MATAREAEALGCETVWVTDDRLQRDVFTVLAAIALGTSEVRLGPGVTNPFSRHPALIATAIATLDELSGGRAVLGLGAGGTNHRALGLVRESPVAGLSEAVELIRGLLAGQELTLDGRVVHAWDAKLDFTPRRESVPIYIGARGPRMLELAGEKADGVIIGNLASREGWSYGVERIAAGAARAGRDPAAIALTAWFYCCIADDEHSALDAVRPMVATSLATSRPILPEIGLELPEAYTRKMETHGWSLEQEAVADAGRELPEDVLRRFSLAGTPASCTSALADLTTAFPAISEVVIVPAAAGEREALAITRRFMQEVAPHLVRAGAARRV